MPLEKMSREDDDSVSNVEFAWNESPFRGAAERSRTRARHSGSNSENKSESNVGTVLAAGVAQPPISDG